MRVLLTRPLEDSRAVAGALAPDGIACLIWPLTRIVPVAVALEIPPGTGGLLFTSANGVRAFAALAPRRDLPALCVGEASAEAARRAGFGDVRSAAGDARALARLAEASGIGRFLHPRGRHATGDLAGWLAGSGRPVAEAVLYEAVETGPAPAPIEAALARGAVGMVTAWSPRAAAILARRLPDLGAELAATDLLAISAGAARPLAGAGFRRSLIAARPDGRSMLAAIRAAARARK
ncbi:MAG TPA: uroporphyrinogen-III synthase [Thermohalobaculum sp.]|nr:uroporphyrinogen-III synthase [Thermohalobaculum sp.]